MEHTRELHIVSAELSILKRTLHPLYTMINALRDQRIVRRRNIPQILHEPTFEDMAPEYKPHGAEISVAAKVYLADVADHVLLITEEIDMLRGTVENMISMVSVDIEVSDSEDIQHGFCHSKRNNETTHDCHRYFPTSHFPRGVFRNEFLSSLLESPHE
jgi:Mg2+ and Co2+ transporter CorA